MSGVYRFEDLRVWQAAKRQCDLVGALIIRPEFRRDQEMSEHMNDASLSVMFNITEGFLRRRDGETLQFLRYSFASNGELKAGYYAADSRKVVSEISCVRRVDSFVLFFFLAKSRMRVGAVGNRARCGFPRSGGRVLGVHGSGGVHARWHFTRLMAKSDLRRESQIDSWLHANTVTCAPIWP
jgi:four helix bundle protein